ncbi:MAG: hypothetical protein RBS68_01460 [Anaerolineales bacterium]|nr:hypothetical protein [Anaerolineales bacterium]
MAQLGRTSIFQIILMILLLPACANGTPTPNQAGIDIRFREFYDLQGGENLLGKPVSAIINQENAQYQVLENAIMVYRPSAPAGEQFTFLALAHNFVSEDSTPAGLEMAGQTTVGRHVIYDEFLALFNRLGGLRFVGQPVTEVRINDEQSRYEQYFENMGFYKLISDPSETVRLLPYGLIECTRNKNLNCTGNFQNAIPEDLNPQPFLPILRRLGNLPGKPLSQVYLSPDNKYEQVYENVVLVFDSQNPRVIGFRALPESVGIQPQVPVAPRNDPGLSFSQTDGALGHNVPVAFIEYIAVHGGPELSGAPISELYEVNGLRRQCFLHYCLEYDPAAPKEYQIRPVNLGYEYLKRQGFSMPDLQVRIWESFPVLKPGEGQVLGVLVYNGTPNAPMQNVQPEVTIFLDGASIQKLIFPATSAAGTSFLNVAGGKLPGLLEYEICVSWPGGGPVCERDSWIVK